MLICSFIKYMDQVSGQNLKFITFPSMEAFDMYNFRGNSSKFEMRIALLHCILFNNQRVMRILKIGNFNSNLNERQQAILDLANRKDL